MATQTTHYSLIKPAYDEAADIETINDNMDTIDEQMFDANSALGGAKFIRKTCVSSGGKVTYTFSGSCAFIILCSGANANVRAQIFGSVTSSGTVTASKYDFGGTPSISTSTDPNKLVLTNGSSGSNCYTCMIVIYGTAPTVA